MIDWYSDDKKHVIRKSPDTCLAGWTGILDIIWFVFRLGENTVYFRAAMDVEKLRRDLKENNQEHLLEHWESLSKNEQSVFYGELQNINFAQVSRSFEATMDEAKRNEKKDEIEPVPRELVGSVIGAVNQNKVDSWRDKGLQAISEGKVAVLLLAGGQGTRLGVSYPKGRYDVGLPSRKSLYQLQAERILKVQELAYKRTGKKGTIRW